MRGGGDKQVQNASARLTAGIDDSGRQLAVAGGDSLVEGQSIELSVL